MDIRDQLPLAPRDLLILVVLAEGPSHGYGLIKAVEERSEAGVLLDPANLYRVLRRHAPLAVLDTVPVSVDIRMDKVCGEGPHVQSDLPDVPPDRRAVLVYDGSGQ